MPEQVERMAWHFEPEIFSPTKPLVSLSILGRIAGGNVHRITDILSGSYSVIERCPSPIVDDETSSSLSTVTSAAPPQSPRNVDVSAEWLRLYQTRRAAAHVVLCGLTRDDSRDACLVAELETFALTKGTSVFALFVPEWEEDLQLGIELAPERRSRLLEARRDHFSVYFALTPTDCANLLPKLSSLHQATERYYRDQVKRYRTKLSSPSSPPSSIMSEGKVPLFAAVRYHFKVGFMQLFLQDMSATIKTFHTAYLQVIEYCRKLESAEQALLLRSLRWTCDVMVYKIVWILAARGDKKAATEYLAGHIAWFSPSFGEDELETADANTWKAKLYDSMARILSILPHDKADHQHAGYYCYLAAKCLMAFFRTGGLEMGMRPVVGNQVLEWLGIAYDKYREDGLRRMTMHIGRLIATQYLAMDNHEQALVTLTRLRMAFTAEGWPSLLGDVLRDLMYLASEASNCLPDPRKEIEYYWQFANANPPAVLDDFDAKIGQLALKIQDEPMVLDASSLLSTNLLKCAARFSRGEAIVTKDDVRVEVLVCNMSPLLMSIASVIVRFTDCQSVADMIMTSEDDVLPGSFLSLQGTFLPPGHGPVEIESVTIDLADLPLRFFFPSFVLSTHESSEADAWHHACLNRAYLKQLKVFSNALLSLQVHPVQPEVQVSVRNMLPLVAANACPLEIVVKNDTDHHVECTLRFSGPVTDVSVVDPRSETIISVLCEYLLRLEVPPKGQVAETIFIKKPTAADITLHLDCHSSFTLQALEEAPNYLSPEALSLAHDCVIPSSMPFVVAAILETEPTERALTPSHAPVGGRRRCALIKYAAHLQVTNNLSHAIHIDDIHLTIENHERVRFVQVGGGAGLPCRENDVGRGMVSGESLSLEYCIDADAIPDLSDTEFLIQPQLVIRWRFPAHEMATMSFSLVHSLPAITLLHQSLFVVPIPADSLHVGGKAIYRWSVWNMSEQAEECIVRIETGEDLVYMGPKQSRLAIEPFSGASLRAAIIPLRAGEIRIPTISLKPVHPGESILYDTLFRPPILVRPQ